jgi:threonine dehydrogenase-like Zn-dependent dehydrogenase
MALDKAIEHGKEKRRPYRGAKAVCASCRNHGNCPYCERGRKHADDRRAPITEASDAE